MGCISSKTDINDLHHNIFQVMNVDERGNRLNPGQLEITETDLVLHQRRKAPVKWPLRCLRRYGFDAELFSFESGRRCPTGPGIYAFRCQRAEQLFNLLQSHIQVRNNAGEDAISRDFPLPVTGPPVALRGNASGDSNYLDPAPRLCGRTVPGTLQFSSHNGITARLDSVGSSSNGPLSPQGTASPSPPPVPISNTSFISSVSTSNPSMHYANEELFHAATVPADSGENNNKILPQPFASCTPVVSASVENTSKENPVARLSVSSGDGVPPVGPVDISVSASYVNVTLNNGPLSPTFSVEGDKNYAHPDLSSETQPVYMNIMPGSENGKIGPSDTSAPVRGKLSLSTIGGLPTSQERETDEAKRCYANLQPGKIEVSGSFIPKLLSGNDRTPMLSPPACQPLQLPTVSGASTQRQVNYIVLDLEQSKPELANVNCTSQQPTSPVFSLSPTLPNAPSDLPHKASEGYATIDFNKTVALSHSVNRTMENDNEGSRKTRHNSTINDLYAPSVRNSSSE